MFNNMPMSEINSALVVIFMQMKGENQTRDGVNVEKIKELFRRDFFYPAFNELFDDIIECEVEFFKTQLPL